MKDQGEAEFAQSMERLALSAITSGIVRFDALLRCLPGLYPTTLLNCLRNLADKDRISEEILADAIAFASAATPKGRGYNAYVPLAGISLIPHPLDYEWRFAEEAIQRILATVIDLSIVSDKVLLLGTPTIFSKVVETGYPRSVVLIDSGNRFRGNLAVGPFQYSAMVADVRRDHLPLLSAKVVVSDPPWYEGYIKPFLWAASQLCAKSGHLLLSIPATGTRPRVDEEFRRTVVWAEKLGFRLLRLEVCVLPYTSPLFELNSLRAEGIHNVPHDWRRGNFAVFEKCRENHLRRPKVAEEQDTWREENVKGIRIRFRNPLDDHVFRDPRLISVVPGDVLPSVSRWDERRRLANVWTSGNRVFGCNGTDCLMEIPRTIESNRDPGEAVAEYVCRDLSVDEEYVTLQAWQQLRSIVEAEVGEYMREAA